jgi:tetratricopeptide (TPR) repeat protein
MQTLSTRLLTSRLGHKVWKNYLCFMVACSLSACFTAEKKDNSSKSDNERASIGEKGKEAEGPESASSTRVTLTNSLSNNPLTSQTIAPAKAESELARFRSGKGELALQGVISTERLARKNPGEILASAKKLAELQMEKGANRTISPEVKLEIALAALQAKNFALAEFFLQELTDSKVAHVKAGAYNAMGVVALRDDRIPEAVLYFREALKALPSYKPSLLNLGFAALKGGEIATAKQLLSKVENDWFVSYGMISIQRLEGDVGGALENCDRVLKKQPEHSAALFNCGLVEYQNKHNLAKAKEYLTKAGRAKITSEGWNEKAFLLISQIDAEEAQVKRDEMAAKAAKAAADKAGSEKAAATKAAADKAKAAPAGPPAEKGKAPPAVQPDSGEAGDGGAESGQK